MLRKEVNDLLTLTGPDTAMGDLFRRYWMPALLAQELPENDCPPVRVKLLSEPLVAFRDTGGRYGLIEEFCAHRRVSLWFGRNEEHGLRCPYHGWKYDVTGQCVEVPSEPEESRFCAKVKLTSYPLVKIGDVLWAYMGPAEHRPPPPEWEFALVPPEQSFTSKRVQVCNWLQALEGGIDSSHVTWLHGSSLKSDPLFKGAKGNRYNQSDAKPVFEVVESDGGLLIGVRRNAEDGNFYWRITPWVMPCFTMIPPRGDHPVHGHFWIPIDDGTCWAWSYDYHPIRALTPGERQAMADGKVSGTVYLTMRRDVATAIRTSELSILSPKFSTQYSFFTKLKVTVPIYRGCNRLWKVSGTVYLTMRRDVATAIRTSELSILSPKFPTQYSFFTKLKVTVPIYRGCNRLSFRPPNLAHTSSTPALAASRSGSCPYPIP